MATVGVKGLKAGGDVTSSNMYYVICSDERHVSVQYQRAIQWPAAP